MSGKIKSSDFKIFYNWDMSDPPRYHHKPIDGEYFDWLFSMLEGTGVTFMYRCNLAGRAYYPSKIMKPFSCDCVDEKNPDAQIWYKISDILERCDPLKQATIAARKYNVSIWVWFNWNEFQNIRRNWLYLIDPVWYESPRKYWCSRDGSRFYHGVPAFGDVQVRDRLLSLVKEVLNYDIDGFYLSTRSHSWYACFPSPGWDNHLEDFGFNDCVVEDYRKQYNIDPRYEGYDRDAFLRIKGEHFSQLLAEVGRLLHSYQKQFIVGIVPDRLTLMGMGKDRPALKYLQLYKDWEQWAANGRIDGICSEKSCPHHKELDLADTSIFQQTLPAEFPVYTWADTAWFVKRTSEPFSLHNWKPLTPQEIVKQINLAKSTGLSGVVLHSLYHYTSADTKDFELMGYGKLPRLEYLEMLKELNK